MALLSFSLFWRWGFWEVSRHCIIGVSLLFGVVYGTYKSLGSLFILHDFFHKYSSYETSKCG